MPSGNKATFLHRRLVSAKAGKNILLDAVEHVEADGWRNVYLFFEKGVELDQVSLPKSWTITNSGLVNGAPWLLGRTEEQGAFELKMAGQSVQITPAKADLDFLKGTNAALSVRNGESAQTVLDWLEFHCTRHGMNAAVILNRAKPGTDKGFFKELERELAKVDYECRLIFVDSNVPMGRPDMPPESHPYSAPDAPGKDRMEIPAADPWSSPLGSLLYYELARARFLGQANAIVNIDVSDLLINDETDNIFNSAVAAKEGVILLEGHNTYPWRARNDKKICFADHICVKFDNNRPRKRWCIAPSKAPVSSVWRLTRIGNAAPDPSNTGQFYRFMSLRHPTKAVAKIVPKASLIEDQSLLDLSKKVFGYKPVRAPKTPKVSMLKDRDRCAIVTAMKNEGPFILEWVAHHRAIGFDDIIVYTNDCDDGTDKMLALLQAKGILQHRENPFRESGLKPQHAALRAAEKEPIIQNAGWVTCIDVDEFINIKIGAGKLDDLFAALPDANMISMVWRLFGNSDIHEFREGHITEQFTRCASEFTPKPHQAWGFKTLFKNIGIFKKMGVHRPKGLNAQLLDQINWVTGSGKPLPKEDFRNAWRANVNTYGYDLVTLNHYAVRSAESFLVKRDRGRVNHVDRDQGLSYWFRMNNNAEEDHSIQRARPIMKAEYEALLADPEIAAMHKSCVSSHQKKIKELRAMSKYVDFYVDLTSSRLEKLSRLHAHFGANVFLSGPDVIPENIIDCDPNEEFFFTVEKSNTTH